jgi:hypothetical protein
LKSPHAERELKKRKRQRRKQQGNQEPCVMRGVYFKNMKWQAAIKVEKKQVHLGTVGSQEEAARLYDRCIHLLCFLGFMWFHKARLMQKKEVDQGWGGKTYMSS